MYYIILLAFLTAISCINEQTESIIIQTYSCERCRSLKNLEKKFKRNDIKFENFIPEDLLEGTSIQAIVNDLQKKMPLMGIEIFITDIDARIEGVVFTFNGDSTCNYILTFCVMESKQPIASLGQYNDSSWCFTNIDSIKTNYKRLLEMKDFTTYQIKVNKFRKAVKNYDLELKSK